MAADFFRGPTPAGVTQYRDELQKLLPDGVEADARPGNKHGFVNLAVKRLDRRCAVHSRVNEIRQAAEFLLQMLDEEEPGLR